MSKYQRDKGKRGECEIARQFATLYGPDVRRGQQSRSRRDGCDVEGTPFWIECKTGANPPVWRAMAQAIDDTDGRMPLAVVRRDRCEALVVLRLEDFLAICGDTYEWGLE